jgi:hypothetical protein
MTDEELRQLFEAIRQENAAAHEETRRALRQENIAAHEETRRALRQENAGAHEETRRLSNVTAEGLRQEIRLVAESVLKVDEKLDRTAEEIRSEMRHGFSETQAMIKFSYAELDRRVSSLEERVDRLEATNPH